MTNLQFRETIYVSNSSRGEGLAVFIGYRGNSGYFIIKEARDFFTLSLFVLSSVRKNQLTDACFESVEGNEEIIETLIGSLSEFPPYFYYRAMNCFAAISLGSKKALTFIWRYIII